MIVGSIVAFVIGLIAGSFGARLLSAMLGIALVMERHRNHPLYRKKSELEKLSKQLQSKIRQKEKKLKELQEGVASN